jgi:hypothetical protein
MPTFKSNRPRVVGRQLVHPFGCVCVACAVKDELRADELQTAITAAERAAVKAAMDAYQYDGGDPIRQRELDLERNAACAALKRLGG